MNQRGTAHHAFDASRSGLRADSCASAAVDQDLLADVAGGDRCAFAKLYDRFAARVLGLIMKIVGDRQAAEDVLQEVFLQVWKRAGEYNPALASPLAWLMLLARGRSIDALRRRNLETKAPSVFHNLPSQAANGHMTMDEDARRARLALAQLPAEQADAITLAFYGGLSYVQIAQMKGEPLGTIKTRIRLGMRKLRETMDRERGSVR